MGPRHICRPAKHCYAQAHKTVLRSLINMYCELRLVQKLRRLSSWLSSYRTLAPLGRAKFSSSATPDTRPSRISLLPSVLLRFVQHVLVCLLALHLHATQAMHMQPSARSLLAQSRDGSWDLARRHFHCTLMLYGTGLLQVVVKQILLA